MSSDLDLPLFTKAFEKMFPGEIMDLNLQPKRGTPGTFIPTPSESLNMALGIGGFPTGRVVEIFGPESSGKSTLALDVIHQAQLLYPDKLVGYLDVEQAVNLEYVETIGINTSHDKFLFTQQQQVDKVLDMAHEMAKGGFSVVVVDSIASLIDKTEMEAQETTHAKMGGAVAKAMSTHLRYMVGTVAKTGTLVIYLNQIRDKLGIVFGSPETTSGGHALKFYATIRVRTQVIEQMKDKNGDVYGVRVRAKTVKNKVAAPYRNSEYTLVFGEGIDSVGDLVDVCVAKGVLTKSGSWFTEEGKNVANGRPAFITYLKENPDKYKKLQEQLWAQ